ncbi:MAG: WXG100 family type VII secretion target [Bacilli bacterium]|nr:WXG100 family type VII secretion target [Bacilli bacterium]
MKVIVKYEELESKIAIIQKNIDCLKEEITNFKNIAKFDKSEWSGTASKVYNNSVVKEFPTYLNNFLVAINQLNKDLKTTSRKYQQIDRLVARSTDGE